MINECNFKVKKATLSGTTVSDCQICNPNLFTGAYSCVGEKECILFQIYQRIADSDI